MNESTERQLRILIEDLVREGKSEREIIDAVRHAELDGGIVVHGRRRSWWR
jgi:hypothetical protein